MTPTPERPRALDDLADIGAVDAVLVDAGGVLVLPDPAVIRAGLRSAGAHPSDHDEAFHRAHYDGVRYVTENTVSGRGTSGDYANGYGLSLMRQPNSPFPPAAFDALTEMFARPSDTVWTRPVDGSSDALRALSDAGLPLAVVSNSDGHVEQVLADLEICQIGPGSGATLVTVVDSHLVGVAKPDPAIFAPALDALGIDDQSRSLYVGDTAAYDVRGALAAGLVPVLLDPYRLHDGLARTRRVTSLAVLARALTDTR